ncbi:hypothetical protein MPL3356_400098 [Mesorhizobium plurifarium]|uniref:Uncharacterized protein n=1 Tax=Mesorhizobium plurifarium TaxID=69974 RepID=A0A090E4T1_MESPL|nr:hypothetical protein MPL3356_400098 [Mesorhizobium plurifarium]
MSRKGKKRPASQEERNSMTWKGTKDDLFKWTNDEWSIRHLPQVRIASLVMKQDHEQLRTTMADICETGAVSDMLEQMMLTKEHLEALVDLLDRALFRSFLVLERLGYSPDNPPPDTPAIDPHTTVQ